MDINATTRFSRVLLTGPPGIGKTTVCKKVSALLREKHREVNGFYTEELRDQNARIGFDIVPVHEPNKRSALARTEKVLGRQSYSKHRVGNYHVFIDNFETVALPLLQSSADVLFIDEVGKMELFSSKFYEAVNSIFFGLENKNICVVATIPLISKVPQRFLPFFERLCADNATNVITVTYKNRDKLPQEIVGVLLQ